MNDEMMRKIAKEMAEGINKDIEEKLFGNSTASTSSALPNLTLEEMRESFMKVRGFLLDIPKPPKFYESQWAITIDKDDPVREERKARTLKERFLSWPWRPWQKYKTVRVPNWKPQAYKLQTKDGDIIIYHPSQRYFFEQILETKELQDASQIR